VPTDPPELYVSAFGPKALEVTARIGDGLNNTAPDARLGGPILDEVRELRDHLTALLTTVHLAIWRTSTPSHALRGEVPSLTAGHPHRTDQRPPGLESPTGVVSPVHAHIPPGHVH